MPYFIHFLASDVYMTDAPPPYPGMMPAPPMYTPPQNAGVQQMPAAYYDPNNPNTAYAAASAPPPAYEDANLYEKKRLKLRYLYHYFWRHKCTSHKGRHIIWEEY